MLKVFLVFVPEKEVLSCITVSMRQTPVSWLLLQVGMRERKTYGLSKIGWLD
jgi:hypothetical protein